MDLTKEMPTSVLREVSEILKYMRERGAACPGDLEETFNYDGTKACLIFYMLENEGLIEEVDPGNKTGFGHLYRVKNCSLVNNLLKTNWVKGKKS